METCFTLKQLIILILQEAESFVYANGTLMVRLMDGPALHLRWVDGVGGCTVPGIFS